MKKRDRIFKLFLNRQKLKFNEIEKALKIRSNVLAYHLETMQKEGLLEKKKSYYSLSNKGEKYIPIFSTNQELYPVPVVLVAVINEDKILLIKRNKRPYKNYWSMIGGKMLLEESFEEASLRQVKEKSYLDCRYISINSVLHEQVKGKGATKHSFILFFTKANTNQIDFKESEYGSLKWFKINKLPKRTIPSDHWLIKNRLTSKIEVKEAFMFDKSGRLSNFNISG